MNRKNLHLKKNPSDIDEYISKLKKLEEEISEKDSVIEALQQKYTNLEMRMTSIEQKKPESEEKSVSEETPVSESIEKFKCCKCDFETHSKRGLNIHKKRKHTNYAIEEYPKLCDVCEKNNSKL